MCSRLQVELKQSKPFSSLRQEAFLQMARTTAMLTHGWEHALRGHGITLTQYNVLRILRGAGERGLCRHEVSSRLVTQVPDVSRLLDRMMRGGLVTRARDKEDRRMVNACITDKGLSLLQELHLPSKVLVDDQLAHLTDAQVQLLIELLEAARIPAGAPPA